MLNNNSLRLNKLSRKELNEKQMNLVRGGNVGVCSSGTSCWCPSVPPGGIETSQNNSDGWLQFDKQGHD